MKFPISTAHKKKYFKIYKNTTGEEKIQRLPVSCISERYDNSATHYLIVLLYMLATAHSCCFFILLSKLLN